MEEANLAQAEKYYTAMGQKDGETIKKQLDKDVEFHGPLATLKGKDAVYAAVNHFMQAISSLTIRAKFASREQAMIVYNIDMPGVVTNFPGASLLQFKEGLIVRIDLFYDGSRFIRQKDEIFRTST